MKKNTNLFLCLLFIAFCSVAQNSKPKVALVLSGGGAKGIAHIPTLQAMDSLGIVPDIIIGTSMRSDVGRGMKPKEKLDSPVTVVFQSAQGNPLATKPL
ncbi:patatin-like phospholipase family protein [Flavicella sp.]|uniref:patatin-like phospholipase family protein n=1 Tax=Flavicella sp. TaxID=2957742 RepID=UPI003449BD2C